MKTPTWLTVLIICSVSFLIGYITALDPDPNDLTKSTLYIMHQAEIIAEIPYKGTDTYYEDIHIIYKD